MTITIPTSAAELSEALADNAKMTQVHAEGRLGEFIANYVAATTKRDETIAQQIESETQKVFAQFLRDHKELGLGPAGGKLSVVPPQATRAQKNAGAAYNRRAPGAVLDGKFDDALDFYGSVWHKQRDAAKLAKVAQVYNSFSEGVSSDGGFLVPETLRAELMSVALETAVIRPRARVIPMETLRVPFPMIDSTSNVSSVFGGISAYWTEEAGALVESQATFGRVVLDAKKLTCFANIPNELLSDSLLSFQAFVDQVFPQAISFFEDEAFINGDGVGQPLGFTNGSAVVQVSKESGQASGTLLWENIVKMYARMLPTSLGRACWFASIDTFPQLATMALSVGTGGSAIWIGNLQQPGDAAPPVSILGRPVIFTEKLPQLGTAGDIMFADLGYYLIGDRQSLEASSSPHYRFQNDQTSYRFIERVDGRPWIQSAITPNNGGPTLSPFVQLQSR